jgi:hypothetical protein
MHALYKRRIVYLLTYLLNTCKEHLYLDRHFHVLFL